MVKWKVAKYRTNYKVINKKMDVLKVKSKTARILVEHIGSIGYKRYLNYLEFGIDL